MHVISRIMLLMIVMTGSLLSCGRLANGSAATEIDQIEDAAESADITYRLIEMADSVLETMSLEQRVGQCFVPSILTSDDSSTMKRLYEYISEYNVGGVLLLKGDLHSAAAMSNICSCAEIPLFCAIDAEWGLGMRLSDAPDFPRNGSIGSKADEELLYDYGREVARECRRVGINMVLGPVIDVAENPKGVIGSRSFGSDPVRVADLGVAYARGLESGNVISVAKHFPGHGSIQVDSHKELPVIKRSLHELDSIDLYPFKSYIDAGLTGVMVGHLAVPAVDPECRPAAVSEVVIKDLLREELEFSGLVLTDALNMGGARGYDASAALLAGADMIISPADTRHELSRVLEKVKSGDIPEEVINDHCRRILFYKFLVDLWNKCDISVGDLQKDVANGTDSLYEMLCR